MNNQQAVFEAWTGIQTLHSEMPERCSTSWAIRAAGSWLLCGSMLSMSPHTHLKQKQWQVEGTLLRAENSNSNNILYLNRIGFKAQSLWGRVTIKLIKSNLIKCRFLRGGENRSTGEKPLRADTCPTWHWGWKSNPGHIGGRQPDCSQKWSRHVQSQATVTGHFRTYE